MSGALDSADPPGPADEKIKYWAHVLVRASVSLLSKEGRGTAATEVVMYGAFVAVHWEVGGAVELTAYE